MSFSTQSQHPPGLAPGVVGSLEGVCALKSIKHRAAGVDLLLLLPLLYFYELLGNAELADLQQSYLNSCTLPRVPRALPCLLSGRGPQTGRDPGPPPVLESPDKYVFEMKKRQNRIAKNKKMCYIVNGYIM